MHKNRRGKRFILRGKAIPQRVAYIVLGVTLIGLVVYWQFVIRGESLPGNYFVDCSDDDNACSSVEEGDYIIQGAEAVVTGRTTTIKFDKPFKYDGTDVSPVAILFSKEYGYIGSVDGDDVGYIVAGSVSAYEFNYFEPQSRYYGKKIHYIALWAKNGIITKNRIPIVQAGSSTVSEQVVTATFRTPFENINSSNITAVASKGFLEKDSESTGGVFDIKNDHFKYYFKGSVLSGESNSRLFWIAVAGPATDERYRIDVSNEPLFYGAKTLISRYNVLVPLNPTFNTNPVSVVASKNETAERSHLPGLFDITKTSFSWGTKGGNSYPPDPNGGPMYWIVLGKNFYGPREYTVEKTITEIRRNGANICGNSCNNGSQNVQEGDEIIYKIEVK